MTRFSKVLSLILLTSMAGGLIADHCGSRSDSCSSDCQDFGCSRFRKKRFGKCNACPKLECQDEEKCPRKECCKVKDPRLAFQACLSFDQVAIPTVEPFFSQGRPEKERPADEQGQNEMVGKFEICFDRGCTKANYKLTIFNINFNNRNNNENLLGAFICEGNSAATIDTKVDNKSPIFALCDLKNPGSPNITELDLECGNIKGDFCCCGEITNEILNDQNFLFPDFFGRFATVVDIKEFMLRGSAFIVVTGSDVCEEEGQTPPKPLYGLASGGAIRAQILPK